MVLVGAKPSAGLIGRLDGHGPDSLRMTAARGGRVSHRPLMVMAEERGHYHYHAQGERDDRS